jgi:hypothetical protein
MRRLIFSSAIALSFFAGSALAGPRPQVLDVRNFVGVLEYRTSGGDELSLEIKQGRKVRANAIAFSKGVLVTSDIGRINNVSCEKRGNEQILKINGQKYYPEDLPKILAKGSNRDGLRIKNSEISVRAGDIGGAAIEVSGCGDIVIGNIKNSLELSGSGSGDFVARDIGKDALVDISGSGDIKLGRVGNNLQLNISGSGDSETGDINGRANVQISGSGDVEIGSAKDLQLDASGSGDIKVNGGKGALNARLSGSGDIEYRGTAVNPVVKSNGSGEVKINNISGISNITHN